MRREPLSSSSALLAEDRVERHAADLPSSSDVAFASAGPVGGAGEAFDLAHGGGGFELGCGSSFAFDCELGEGGLGLHGESVKHLTTKAQERKVLYMKTTSSPAVTYIPFGDRNVHEGFRIDGSKVRFWATKKQATAGAKSIGWPVDSLTKVYTRFCGGWALADGRFGFLSKDSFAALHYERNGEAA